MKANWSKRPDRSLRGIRTICLIGTSGSARTRHAEPVGPHVVAFRPDVPDFVLYRAEPGADASRVPLEGPAIVLAEGDGIRLRGAVGGAELARGEAAYVTPDETGLEVSGDGIAWIATTGSPAASVD